MSGGNHTILIIASIILWIEGAGSAVRAITSLVKEKPASMIAYAGEAVGYGCIAARLWGVA